MPYRKCKSEPAKHDIAQPVPYRIKWNQCGSRPLTRVIHSEIHSGQRGDDVTRTLAASHHRTVTVPNLPELAPNDPTGPRFLVEDVYPSLAGGPSPLKGVRGAAF